MYGSVLTSEGVASNNRGETAGNVATIQKILRDGEIYTTVSAEAIRYAIREYWTRQGKQVNREISPDGNDTWNETDDFSENEKEYLDDDVLGYMDPSEDTVKRRGRLEVSRAVSTNPWSGDVMFNVASQGAHPDSDDPSPYSTEVHDTRYQYLFALTPEQLHDTNRFEDALNAIRDLRRVAGNHSRFLYDFSPEAIVLRWTQDPAPRMMYCFDESDEGQVSADLLLDRIESGDIDGEELYVGGSAIQHMEDRLEEEGVDVFKGIKSAFDTVKQQARQDLDLTE